MRILEVITLGEIGGAQTVLVDLVKGFSKLPQVEIDIVVGPGDFIPEALTGLLNVNIIQIPFLVRQISPSLDIKALMFLVKLCKKNSYDLIHCHSSKASWLARLAGTITKCPRICMTVHGLSFYNGNSQVKRAFYSLIERIALPLATDYVFVNSGDLEVMEKIGLDCTKTVIIPNGRPVPPKPEKDLRQLIGLSKSNLIVCMIARLSPVKNPMLFLRIAKKVIEQFSQSNQCPHFVLIGDGPLKGECEQYLKDQKLEKHVHLLDAQVNAGKYFWDADIVVLTSEYEACPLVAIEAMAVGIPIVASDVGGTQNVVRHGVTGYLYSLDNTYEPVDYIIKLIVNRQLREGMGRKAFEEYQDKFNVERMYNQYIESLGLRGEV